MKSAHLSNQDKLNLISSLATLLSSGIPILEAVHALEEEARGSTKKILGILEEDLNQGKTISESFARFPKAFDPVTVNIIKAAEEAGNLDTTLKDLTHTIKKDIEFTNKVKGGLVYPALVIMILLAVILMNLFFVIPRVAKVFTRLKIQLPLPTRILLATSDLIVHNTLLAVGILIIFAALIYILFKTKKSLILGIIYSLPLISKLIKEIDITRFTRSMSLLLVSGIPITEALSLSQYVVAKKEIQSVIKESEKLVSAGKNLSQGLKKFPKVIPSFATRIVEAGEKSGTLEKSMQEISEQFDERTSNRLNTLVTLLEPILLVIVGVMVGGIMLAIIAPIYGLIGKINTR